MRPEPTSPARPRISPSRSVNEASWTSGARVRPRTWSTVASRGGLRSGNSASMRPPTMCPIRVSTGVSAGSSVATVRPSFSTVTRSPSWRTSPSRCEIQMIPTPSAASRRTTLNSASTSTSSRTADGSSRMSSLTECDNARAIETTCCCGRPQRRHRRGRGDVLVPEPGEQRGRLAVHRRPVQQRTAVAFVAQEHVQGDRQMRDQVELLIDGGDAPTDRGVGVADRERLAFEPHLTRGRLDQPGDALDERGLAGAVLADQAVHLAAGHGQIDPIEGAHARVVLDQPADLQQRTAGFAHRFTSGSTRRSSLDSQATSSGRRV